MPRETYDEPRMYVNLETQKLLIATEKPEPTRDHRRLPVQLGIYWHTDQSKNQLVYYWGHKRAPDHTFNPAEDPELAFEYLDQILDMY